MSKLDYSSVQLGTYLFSKNYVSHISKLLADLDWHAIGDVIEVLNAARLTVKTIFLAGNGGSAATCSHFAEDLTWGIMQKGKRPCRALSLTDNVPSMTAVSNDKGYENIFVSQIEALFNAGDILIAISASGNSQNLIRAAEYVNNNGGITIGLVGFDGGKLKSICHHCIHIKTATGEYGIVEGIHSMLTHLITTYLAELNGDPV